LTEGIDDGAGRIAALATYVGTAIAYVNPDGNHSLFEPAPASEVLRTARGDCKDMAVLLVAMLREAGISAYPALTRRRAERPLADELPSPYYFDHAVVVVSDALGRYRWLDPTAMSGEPPEISGDCVALVLEEQAFDFRRCTP
jgi:transglutaminase-like putative cysteine protease